MVNLIQPDDSGIATASELINSGNLVVIPTETVYGLASNALNPESVAKIFLLKGRPATNPIIVHIASGDQIEIIAEPNQDALALAKAFWPGPLTIVLPAKDTVPRSVTAGGATVGVRVPNHPAALKLLRACRVPLAAPSANRSEAISPTTPELVVRSLGSSTPPMIDGGPCKVGIESTVIDLTSRPYRILRPGAISREQIELVLGDKILLGGDDSISRSPGQMKRHYAPKTTAILSDDLANLTLPPGQRYAVLHYTDLVQFSDSLAAIRLPEDPVGYAAGLYAALSALDDLGHNLILIEKPPTTEKWAAVIDRLTRATSK